MTQHIEVIAAYGRKYTNLKTAKADWEKGLDFRIVGGPYVGKGEAEAHDLRVVVRYGSHLMSVGKLR